MRSKARKQFHQEDPRPKNKPTKQRMKHSQVTTIDNAPFDESPDEKKRRIKEWQSAQEEV